MGLLGTTLTIQQRSFVQVLKSGNFFFFFFPFLKWLIIGVDNFEEFQYLNDSKECEFLKTAFGVLTVKVFSRNYFRGLLVMGIIS